MVKNIYILGLHTVKNLLQKLAVVNYSILASGCVRYGLSSKCIVMLLIIGVLKQTNTFQMCITILSKLFALLLNNSNICFSLNNIGIGKERGGKDRSSFYLPFNPFLFIRGLSCHRLTSACSSPIQLS